MGAPKGLILFRDTPVSGQLSSQMMAQIYLWIITGIGVSVVSIFLLSSLFKGWLIYTICIVAFFPTILSYQKKLRMSEIPLAVNLNHPFMETNSVDKSEIMVCFDGTWIEPGINHLKLVKDNLGVWLIHRNDSELSILGTWDTSLPKEILQKQLTIINQAISMNNAINNSNIEFDDAREREKQESELLEREWIEQEEIEVSGPILRMLGDES
ncbi:MAG: hypothetical protein QGI21_05735 [Candidatus Poseidoniaceae archaeon]|jgi:hypothetical protein|nr:hypothetical protein [Candidatus Poseidoniaceae archaeon]